MQYAEESLSPAIGRIKGVNRVTLSGATPMEWRLTYDSDRLCALGLTPADIAEAIAGQGELRFIGMAADVDGEWLAVRSVAGDNRDFDITDIYLTTPDSALLRLDQLVTARHTEARPTGYYRISGFNSIYCNIYADEDANQIELAARIKYAVSSIDLPHGYSLILSSDATENISAELNKIYFRTALTLIILLIFVGLVTMNLRYMLVIIISLVISLCISVIFYRLLGIEIQFYSLAGITISLNLIIDNIIVMSDHYRRKRDRRTFTAILAATLTTIGALAVVFFLDDELRLNLQDFVAVVIVNLAVSLAVALWLVPALIERFGLKVAVRRSRYRRLRRLARFNRAYAAYIRFARRWRLAILLLFALAFAGSLRLFVTDVYEGSYFNRSVREPVLQISATLPNGSTLEQMNGLVRKMEAFLGGFDEIAQFRTDIYSARRANISVSFTRGAARSGFPYQLKDQVIGKALTLGGGSWAVYGLEDRGFDNSVTESAGSYQVRLTGYNYDELEALAERFRQKLLSHRRIKEVTVGSEFSWAKDDYTEFYLALDRDAMARSGISVNELYSALTPVFGRDVNCGTTYGTAEKILLGSRQSGALDVWALMNMPFTIGDRTFKLSQFASVEQVNAPKSVAKENQQYILCLQYEYIGSQRQGGRILEKDINEFRHGLPMGYSIENLQEAYMWKQASAANYWLLLLVVAIIFWITAILFNSLSRPLIIIAIIPVSFIGVFMAFYLTGMNFDQGGFASFILLCGITVNSAIYLLNEYNRTGNYLRAFNAKIIPILLTVLSTILGFIPFIVGKDSPEPFWFPLALGTIGGLLTSLPALLLLPLPFAKITLRRN